MFSSEFSFCLFTSYAYICTCIRRHLKETILWSSITWSEMGKQNVQAEKVYWTWSVQVNWVTRDRYVCWDFIKAVKVIFTVMWTEGKITVSIVRNNHTGTLIWRPNWQSPTEDLNDKKILKVVLWSKSHLDVKSSNQDILIKKVGLLVKVMA